MLVEPPPHVAPAGSLLFVPAFAEELNKSRRMVARGARALAAVGWTTLILDPFGCGDSPGDFADASWAAWIDDVVLAHGWLAERTGVTPGLWAMRAGAVLAAAALPRMGRVVQCLLWQPVLSGEIAIQQFLRLRVAAGAIGGAVERTTSAELLARLECGKPVDIGGYRLAPSLALPMRASGLEGLAGVDRLTWLEVSLWEPAEIAPASLGRIAALRSAGTRVRAEAVKGPPFWLAQEIEECDALLEATLRAVESK